MREISEGKPRAAPRAAFIARRRLAKGWVWIKEEEAGRSQGVSHHGNLYQEKNEEQPSLKQVSRKKKQQHRFERRCS